MHVCVIRKPAIKIDNNKLKVNKTNIFNKGFLIPNRPIMSVRAFIWQKRVTYHKEEIVKSEIKKQTGYTSLPLDMVQLFGVIYSLMKDVTLGYDTWLC